MNVSNIKQPQAPERAPRRDPVRTETSARLRDSRETTRSDDVDATEDPNDRDDKAPVTRAEFSALLALLAGAGQQVRTNLTKQLPDETASLVDKLLEDANAQGNAQGDSEMGPPALTAQEAGEALHYGLLKLPQRTNDDIVDLAVYARQRNQGGTPNVDGLARAVSRVADQANDKSKALEALSRVASQRGTSLEQLMAMGDTRGADARKSLDALLSAAGTPAGARLAARQLLNSTSASALGGDATMTDAMANLETLRVKNSADVAAPSKSLDGVSAELQAKVARVVERMKDEYGHTVSIAETTRTQERQNWLYEQGRTRDGNVVTWTRESAHTRGEAVDVMIDGGWDNADAFARLQRIAKEEGLRTLGARDPGHLELPNATGGATGAQLASAERTSRDTQSRERASVAGASVGGASGIARVAGVAGVAGVAATARDARTGTMASNGIGSTVSAYASSQSSGRGRTESDSSDNNGRGREQRSGLPLTRDKARPETRDTPAFGALNGSGTNGQGLARGHDVAVNAPAQVTGSSQAERVSDIQQMRSDAPATPLSRMTLNVEGANGSQERITVDVRGNTVSAHISTDADTADRLRLRTADLQDALGRHGLDGDTVRISNSGRAQDGAETARAIGSERDALKLATTGSAAQDGAQGNGQQQGRAPREWDRQDDPRREQTARAREERQRSQQDAQQDAQDQKERQRRQTLFTGNA